MSFSHLIPSISELPARPRRVILHWSGGTYTPNAVDLAHYHFVVTGDGEIVEGKYSVADNMRSVSGSNYAMHTGGFNSYSVGISFCGMKGWTKKGDETKYPLKEDQFLVGLRFVAECCKIWGLDPSNSAHLFSHREAWTLHKVKGSQNHVKPDITYLPFYPDLAFEDIGPNIRARTHSYLIGRD